MYDYGTFLYESHICSKYEAMILNWFHNRAEYFVQIMCKFQKVSCHRNETARSNVLPTVNKYFNCIMCMYKGVALAPSVSVCLCCCILNDWGKKLVVMYVQRLGLCRRLYLIFFLFLSFIRSTVHLYIHLLKWLYFFTFFVYWVHGTPSIWKLNDHLVFFLSYMGWWSRI